MMSFEENWNRLQVTKMLLRDINVFFAEMRKAHTCEFLAKASRLSLWKDKEVDKQTETRE